MKMLRMLWKYSTGFRYAMVLLPLAILAQVALETWIPYLMGEMLDTGIYSGDMNLILRQGGRMALASVGMMAVGLAISRLIALWSAGVTRNIRDALFARAQALAFADTDKYGTAAILTRMSTDINYVKKGLGMFHSLLHSPMTVMVTLMVTANVYPQATGIFLLGAGGFILINIFVVRYALRHYRNMFQRYDELNELLEENVTAQKTVKAFAREEAEQARFDQRAAGLRREARIAETVTMLNEPLLNLVMDICILAIILLSGKAIVSGSMQTGDYFCLITYANQILFQISLIALIMVPILNTKVSMDRIFEIVDLKPSVADGKDAGAAVTRGAVRFENVSFRYGDSRDVLSEINLDIKPGEFIGVIGSSGSGKTSLINLIPRFYDVTAGRVSVDETDVRAFPLRALRGGIGLVPQGSLLFSGTIAENLLWGNEDASPEEIVRAAAIAGANDFVMRFPQGYETRISQGGTSVSGGQRQRLCIARALIRRPKILILDDSLSAVDNATESSILNAFSRELKDTTVILVSQRFSSVRHADRIVVLDRGRVESIGTHDELLAGSRVYRELYETQRRTME